MTFHAFSPYSAQAGSARVRLFDWLDHLGLEVNTHTYVGQPDARGGTLSRNALDVARAEVRLRRLDVRGTTVFVSREASPLSSGELERRLLSTASHSVFDFDDALFEDAGRMRRVLGQRYKCRESVQAADVVVAGNDYLADWAAEHARHVVVIPSCVEPSAYQQKTSWELAAVPVLVWLGSPSTEQYLVAISTALADVHRRTGARLRLISGAASNPALASIEHMIDRVPWNQDSVARELVTADIAIGPLTDTPYARGKCAYKLLQYAATGLPIVASPVGANAMALERFSGVAVPNLTEWSEAIQSLLLDNAESRAQRGRRGIREVWRHYSYASWAESWRLATGLAQ